MCGHEKYLKTTMHGLTSLYPDYCIVVIGANMGITKMTKEHLVIAWTLKLPIVVVFTKLDLAPENVYQDNMKKITQIIKRNFNKIPVQIKSMDEVNQIKSEVGAGQVWPIFSTSCYTGEGINLVRALMGLLPVSIVRTVNKEENKMIEKIPQNVAGSPAQLGGEKEIVTKFIIDSRYQAKGVGLILGGTVLKGTIRVDQQLMFGPDKNGNFRNVVIKGIHENRVSIEEAGEMSSICVNVKTVGKNTEPIKNNQIRKGSCLINPIAQKIKGQNPYHLLCVKYFDAKIKVLHHHTTIQDGYQGVLHIGGVRATVQAVRVQHKDKKENHQEKEAMCMRTGDEGIIRFKFKYGVEFIEKGAKIMVREGNTKAFGSIIKVYPMNQPPEDLVDNFTANDARVGAFAVGEKITSTKEEAKIAAKKEEKTKK